MDDKDLRRDAVLALAKLGLTNRHAYRVLRAKMWAMVQAGHADGSPINKTQSIELN